MIPEETYYIEHIHKRIHNCSVGPGCCHSYNCSL